jgi:hypothetical protein
LFDDIRDRSVNVLLSFGLIAKSKTKAHQNDSDNRTQIRPNAKTCFLMLRTSRSLLAEAFRGQPSSALEILRICRQSVDVVPNEQMLATKTLFERNPAAFEQAATSLTKAIGVTLFPDNATAFCEVWTKAWSDASRKLCRERSAKLSLACTVAVPDSGIASAEASALPAAVVGPGYAPHRLTGAELHLGSLSLTWRISLKRSPVICVTVGALALKQLPRLW